MSEAFLIWAFAGLMVLNVFASFLYLLGLNELKAGIRRAYQNYTAKPR